MTPIEIVGLIVLLAGMALFALGAIKLVGATNSKGFKLDVAPAKGSVTRGIFYSFTFGMLPWAKESTRKHLVAYVRGIVFHIGVFGALAVLIASPWMWQLNEGIRSTVAVFLAIGTVAALGGFWIRLTEESVRVVSTPDDYFSLGLVTVFIASSAVACVVEGFMPGFLIVSGLVLAYLPYGKLKHSIYFFYTRKQFGSFFGYRGVLKTSRRPS